MERFIVGKVTVLLPSSVLFKIQYGEIYSED